MMAATMKVLTPAAATKVLSAPAATELPRLSEGSEEPAETPVRSLSGEGTRRRRQQSMWSRRPSLSGSSMHLARSSEAGTFQ